MAEEDYAFLGIYSTGRRKDNHVDPDRYTRRIFRWNKGVRGTEGRRGSGGRYGVDPELESLREKVEEMEMEREAMIIKKEAMIIKKEVIANETRALKERLENITAELLLPFPLLESPLMGNVFLYDDNEVGDYSLHFDKEIGCYLSFEHSSYSSEEFDDGTAWPSCHRHLFTEQSYDSDERKFCGLAQLGGTWEGDVSVKFELVFDTKFLCILSGSMVRIKMDGDEGDSETIGEDCSYTNLDLDGRVDIKTTKRLEEEGATTHTIHPFLETTRKLEAELEFATKQKQLKKEYDAARKPFGELTERYYKIIDNKVELVDMSQPRPCSYSQKTKYDYGTKRHDPIKTILIKAPSSSSTSTTPPVESRAITLRQLWGVEGIIIRRCIDEGWTNRDGITLTPEKVTFYDVNEILIKPFTKEKKQSFVTCLPSTAGPQPPRFVASHWWGEAVLDLIRCLEQFVEDFGKNETDEDERKGGGMSVDTPIWVYAYGINPHALNQDITKEPYESDFSKAMLVARGRTISIFDMGGVIFSRIWCVYESYLKLVDARKDDDEGSSNDGVWAVYTAKSHHYTHKDYLGVIEEKREAIGIISGGATVDYGDASRIAAREHHFPFDLITNSLGIRIENAEASEDKDRVRILNLIRGCTGNDIDETPPATHSTYTAVEDALKATFASSVEKLQKASKESDEVWLEYLTALSNGKKVVDMKFDFNEDGWSGLTVDRATKLVSHLPRDIVKLSIYNSKFGVKFMEALIERVGKLKKLKTFGLAYVSCGDTDEGEEFGARLAEIIAANTTIETLYLYWTDLVVEKNAKQWGASLITNNTLTTLYLSEMAGDIKTRLDQVTKDRSQELVIY